MCLSLDHPNGGHGFALSKDGYNLPETTTAPTQMSTAEELGVPDTIMRFKFDDGTPYPQTIAGQTASDWKLIPHPTIVGQFQWVPLTP